MTLEVKLNFLFSPDILDEALKLMNRPALIDNLHSLSCSLRPLEIDDWDKSFREMLNQLNSVDNLNRDFFRRHFDQMKSSNGAYYCIVIEELKTAKIVASGMLIIIRKFYSNCESIGRIEAVIVDEKFRGKHLGQLIIFALTYIGKYKGLSEIILESMSHTLDFYYKCEFKVDQNICYMDKNYM